MLHQQEKQAWTVFRWTAREGIESKLMIWKLGGCAPGWPPDSIRASLQREVLCLIWPNFMPLQAWPMYLNGCFFDRCSMQIIPNWKFVAVILNTLQARLPKENIGTSKGQTLQKLKLMILACFQGEGGLQLCPAPLWPQKNITSLNGDLTNPANPSAFTDDLTRDTWRYITPFLNPRGECIPSYLTHQSPSVQNKIYRITPQNETLNNFLPSIRLMCAGVSEKCLLGPKPCATALPTLERTKQEDRKRGKKRERRQTASDIIKSQILSKFDTLMATIEA